MGVSENLKRGVTEIVLLALLSQQDMYGYEMAQAMRERSHEKFTLLETSMYPTLYRLQDNGYISAREELVGKRRKRTYYHLEPAGEQRLKELTQEYEEITKGVLQIIEGCDTDGSQCPSSAVSMESARGTAGQQETEETNPVQGGVLRPGFCY